MQQLICRTCDGPKFNSLHPLGDHTVKYPEKMLADLLQDLVKIDLPNGIAKKLPQYICDGCTKKLLDAYDFVEQARDVTKLLIKQLQDEANPAVKTELVEEQNDIQYISSDTMLSADDEGEDKITILKSILDSLGDVDVEDDASLDDMPLQQVLSIRRTAESKQKKQGISSRVLRKRKLPQCRSSLKCKLCKRSFRKLSDMNRHIRTHTGEKPFKCDLCDKSFGQMSGLNDHRRTHTDEKQYKCDYCKKSFSLNSTLKRHERTHTGEKHLKCDLCNRHFALSSTLKDHRRTHTGEKHYKCDLCDKSFIKKSKMERHRRTHSDEDPGSNNDVLKREPSARTKSLRGGTESDDSNK